MNAKGTECTHVSAIWRPESLVAPLRGEILFFNPERDGGETHVSDAGEKRNFSHGVAAQRK